MIIQGSVASLSFNDSRPSLWDPAIVRAVATEEEKFDETLRWSIQDAIRNILGESGLEAVRSILHLDELAKNPGEFHGQMDRIFGRGVLAIESVVVKALFRRLTCLMWKVACSTLHGTSTMQRESSQEHGRRVWCQYER